MKDRDRQQILKFGAIGMVGLLVLNWLIITPAWNAWAAQSKRIAALEAKVKEGKQLRLRAGNIRTQWAEMQRTDLPEDVSMAENDAFKAVGRWARDSKITFTSLTPQWRAHEDEGYETLECRVAANGDQISLSRFIYEMETDPAPVALHECEITSRDAKGQQITLGARFSFIRLAKVTTPMMTTPTRRTTAQ